MNLSERLENQINELKGAAVKGAAKFAKSGLKKFGKGLAKASKSTVKRNAGTIEAAVVAGAAAPIGQKIYDRIEKSSKLRKKSKEQANQTATTQTATTQTAIRD